MLLQKIVDQIADKNCAYLYFMEKIVTIYRGGLVLKILNNPKKIANRRFDKGNE